MRLVTGSAKADRDALSAHGADECRKAGHVFALDRTGQASHVDMDGTRMYVTDLVLAIVPPTKIAPNLREVRNRLVTPNVAELPIQEQIFVREPGAEGFERMMGRTRKAENM